MKRARGGSPIWRRHAAHSRLAGPGTCRGPLPRRSQGLSHCPQPHHCLPGSWGPAGQQHTGDSREEPHCSGAATSSQGGGRAALTCLRRDLPDPMSLLTGSRTCLKTGKARGWEQEGRSSLGSFKCPEVTTAEPWEHKTGPLQS